MNSVVYATNNNYMVQTIVSIKSLCEQCEKCEQYKIYVLVDNKFDENNIRFLQKTENYNCDIEVEICVIDDSFFEGIKDAKGYPITTFYRLLLPSILKGEKRCLFIDGDTLIVNPLTELFEMDMKNNLVAGVVDGNLTKKNYPATVGVCDDYLNAGVMLWNLEKMREESIGDQFIKSLAVGYEFNDQDIINVVCQNRKKVIDDRWNKMIVCAEESKNDAIIHFAGSFYSKPWNSIRMKYSEQWWAYADSIVACSQVKLLRDKMQMVDKSMEYMRIVDVCKNYKSIYIWGAGKCGLQVLEYLTNAEVEVDGFIDSDISIQGKEIDNCLVYSKEQVLTNLEVKNTLIIISVQRYRDDISNELMKISDINVLTYYMKNIDYYKTLQSKYYDYEIKELEKKLGKEFKHFSDEEKEEYGIELWYKQ